MGNAFSALQSAFTWDQVRTDINRFDWFDGEAELDKQLAEAQGTQQKDQNQKDQTSTQGKRKSPIVTAHQPHHPHHHPHHHPNATIAKRNNSSSSSSSNHTPRKSPPPHPRSSPTRTAAGGNRKRKDSPNKLLTDTDQEVEMEDVNERAQQQHEQLRKRASIVVGGKQSASSQQHQRTSSTTNSNIASFNIHTSNTFGLLSPLLSKKTVKKTADNKKSVAAPAQVTMSREEPIQSSHVKQEIKYSSNPRITASRVSSKLLSAKMVATSASSSVAASSSASAAASAGNIPQAHPLYTGNGSTSSTVSVRSNTRPGMSSSTSSMISPNVSYAKKAGSSAASSSVSASSTSSSASIPFTIPQTPDWKSVTNAACNSEFYTGVGANGASGVPRLSPPPPPPSEFMTKDGTSGANDNKQPYTSADILGLITPIPMDLSGSEGQASVVALPQLSSLGGLTPEILAEAMTIVEMRKKEKVKLAKEEEEAKKLVSQSAVEVPMAPPMDIPAPPQAPPMAPALLTRAESAPVMSSNKSSSAPLKKFHWHALPAAAVEKDTLWAELGNTENGMEGGLDLDLDMSDVERVFSMKPVAPIVAPTEESTDETESIFDSEYDAFGEDTDMPDIGSASLITPIKRRQSFISAPKPKPRVTLLDAKRSYNVSIALARYISSGTKHGRTYQTVRKDIIELSPALLQDEEQLHILYGIMPTEEEVKLITTWTQAHPNANLETELAPVEGWFACLSSIPHVKSRLALLLTVSQFRSSLTRLNEWLGLVEQSCKEIRGSTQLKSLLVIVLKLGNYLNAANTTSKKASAAAHGFRLSSLSKLKFTKTSDGTSTLLHYLITFIKRECPAVREWMHEIASVEMGVRVEYNVVQQEVKQLRDGLKLLEQENARCSRLATRASSSVPVDESVQSSNNSMRDYSRSILDEYAPLIDAVSKRLKTVLDITHALGKYFGEQDSSWEVFFSYFTDFLKAFKQAEYELTQLETTKAEELKRKQSTEQMRRTIESRRLSNISARRVSMSGSGSGVNTATSTPSSSAASIPMNHFNSGMEFSDGIAFDFGTGEGEKENGAHQVQPILPAATADRRHTICNIMRTPSLNDSFGLDLASPQKPLIRQRGGAQVGGLQPVREEMTSPARNTRSQRPILGVNSEIMNSPLRGTQTAGAKRSSGGEFTSPTKHSRTATISTAGAHAVSQAQEKASGKEN